MISFTYPPILLFMIALLLDSKKIDLACIYGNCFEHGKRVFANEAPPLTWKSMNQIYRRHSE
jgi:hypothetical protein